MGTIHLDTNAPIENAVVRDASKNFDSFTNHDGIATIPRHKAGHFIFLLALSVKLLLILPWILNRA